jgi:hypothetical protein
LREAATATTGETEEASMDLGIAGRKAFVCASSKGLAASPGAGRGGVRRG